ncbi:MAG: helix-hairpin-helix domain-containing protein [Bacteroidota bacterium]
MKKHLTTYFSFSKKELNGILVLCIVIVLTLAFPVCYRYFDEPQKYDLTQFQEEIALFEASKTDRTYYTTLKYKVEESELEPEYFEFDPNSASVIEWQKLGLSARQVTIVRNYVSKGGKFFRKEDLKKIYSISAKQYKGLEPYIRIAQPERRYYSNRKLPVVNGSHPKKDIAVVELNGADSIMLDQLRGIGPAFASRTIRFRERLGGFYDKEQLREIYGMDSVRYSMIESQISVDALSIKKINVNRATFEDLRRHPYLNFKQINALIQYRKQHGNYSSPEDLKKVLILNEEIIRKIGPYLSFDP